MPKAKGYKHLTPAEFDAIKHMLGLGLSVKQAAAISKRSIALVHVLAKSSSLEDYLERNRQARAPKAELETSLVEVAAIDSVMEAEEMPRVPMQIVDPSIELARALNRFEAKIDSLIGRIDDVLETKRPWLNKIKF